MDKEKITDAFITEAANILGDTDNGFTSFEISRCLLPYATKYNRDIPHTTPPFKKKDGTLVSNKRTALRENLQCFSNEELYIIIRDLCELQKFQDNQNVLDLKMKLFRDYSTLAPVGEIEEEIIGEPSHWLEIYHDAFLHYNKSYRKYKSHDAQLVRNTLDDARLALELLLKAILGNEKSLENQKSKLGEFIAQKGGTKEFSNMFRLLLNHYSNYQNNRIKHNENIAEAEITFIFELTTVFMRQLVRLNS
ncbi:hypothetical protein [Prevotella sp.]